MKTAIGQIAISAINIELLNLAEKLAINLGLPFMSNPFHPNNTSIDYFLVYKGTKNSNYQLSLITNKKPYPEITVDFLKGKTAYRIRQSNTVSQPLAKAIGLKKGKRPQIIDATAGMARDSAVLANLGCQVQLVERSPVVGALLEDGLRRLSLVARTNDNMSNRIVLHKGDAKLIVPKLNPADVIYLDPMYPKRDKQALVKKEMRFTRDIVGDDYDTAELLAMAINHARQRVVVKRPLRAPNLDGVSKQPCHSIYSKNTRYDVYLIK